MNITSQPTFSNNPLFCDNYIRLFNTSISQPPFAPQYVQGNVSAVVPYGFAGTTSWSNVYGLLLDTPFIENNYVRCSSLQGSSIVEAPSSTSDSR
jgi:hypothetical protein